MSLLVICKCGKELTVPETLIGKYVECPACGTECAAPSAASDATTLDKRLDPPPSADPPTLSTPPPPDAWITKAPSLHVPERREFAREAGSTAQTDRYGVVVPGYEILGELGRGGMGVVYKARHLALKRIVALKMVLDGAHAGADSLARFRAEAEAVAKLQHANIVQVYEVGESQGRPFFALEYVEGGSLDRKLKGTPQPPREAAELVEQLARAMHAVHQAGLVHRDLKPANVLLASGGCQLLDSDGAGAISRTPAGAKLECLRPPLTGFVPKITDFGLAKDLSGESGQTASGAIMGTPSYMAPEQAAGKVREIGPPADVYALGAILYELLTGRPPFKGANVMETLMQVIHVEPVPPVRLNPQTPRDLEVICLKCLHKEAARRYDSALELAEELRRFRTGEPIQARPAGRLERGWRWCRRNPAVAALLALVVVALTAGTVVSTYFAIDAARKAETAKGNEAEAKRNAETAKTNETAAKAARDDVKKANSNLKLTLAHSLLRPLGLHDDPWKKAHLAAPEIEALWELAQSQDGEFGLLFVKEALRSAVTTRQLRIRAHTALHAAIGLNPGERERLEELLVWRLQDGGLDEVERTDVALVLAALGHVSPRTAGNTGQALARAMSQKKGDDALIALAAGLSAVTIRMKNDDEEVAEALAYAMSKTTDWIALSALAQGVAVSAGRLKSAPAARLCARAADAIIRATEMSTYGVNRVIPGLAAVAARLNPSDAARIGDAIAGVKARIDPANDPDARRGLTRILGVLAVRMEPGRGIAILADTIKTAKGADDIGALADSLAEVAAGAKPDDALLAVGELAKLLSLWGSTGHTKELARALATTGARPASVLVAKTCALAAEELIKAIGTVPSHTEERESWEDASTRLSVLLAWMDRADAAKIAQALAKEIGEKEWTPQPALARALSAATARMEATVATELCAKVVDDLDAALARRKDDKRYLAASAEVVAVLAPQLEPAHAARLCALKADALSKALAEKNDAAVKVELGCGVSALAARLEPARASRLCAQAADVLVGALTAVKNNRVVDDRWNALLAHSLSTALSRLDPDSTAKVAEIFVKELTGRMGDNLQGGAAIGIGLVAVADRLDPAKASEVVDALTQALSRAATDEDLGWLAVALAALADQLEPARAASVCTEAADLLIKALGRWEGEKTVSTTYLTAGLDAVLTDNRWTERAVRSTAIGSAVGLAQPLAIPAALTPASLPLPCRFSTQELVEMLKRPLCIGPARHVILHHLENRYRREFADHWEFVRFAKEQKLALDVTTPPKR